MDYKLSDEIESNQNMFENSRENENNSFQKELSEMSKNFPQLISINMKEQSSSLSNSIINIVLNDFKDNKVPYLDNDEIQKFK